MLRRERRECGPGGVSRYSRRLTMVPFCASLTKHNVCFAKFAVGRRTVPILERRESGMIASKFVATLDLISLLHPLRVRDQLTADGPKTRTLQKRAISWKTCQRSPAPLGTE